MITERDTVILKTDHNDGYYAAANKKTTKFAVTVLVIGALLFIAGIILWALSISIIFGIILMVVGLSGAAFGGGLTKIQRESSVRSNKWVVREEFEFFSDRIEVRKFVNDEEVGYQKIYLEWIDYKETGEDKDFFNIVNSANGGSREVYTVYKSSESVEELNIVRALLKIPLKPDGQIPPYSDSIQADGQTADEQYTEQPTEDTQPEESVPEEQPAEDIPADEPPGDTQPTQENSEIKKPKKTIVR